MDSAAERMVSREQPDRPRPSGSAAQAWGAFLKETRRRRGVSQRALARELGVSQARVAQIESGASAPQVDTMAAYIAALGGELVLSARFDGGSGTRTT